MIKIEVLGQLCKEYLTILNQLENSFESGSQRFYEERKMEVMEEMRECLKESGK